MAILHSRFKRVYYGITNADFGGLGSQYKIHVERSLNHHFEVYRKVLEKECQSEKNL